MMLHLPSVKAMRFPTELLMDAHKIVNISLLAVLGIIDKNIKQILQSKAVLVGVHTISAPTLW